MSVTSCLVEKLAYSNISLEDESPVSDIQATIFIRHIIPQLYGHEILLVSV